jgi:phosphonate transport system substrate-binding protein
VLSYVVWEQEMKAGKIDPKQVVKIWETPTYPDYHWVARGDIDKVYGAGTKDKLQAIILGIDDPKMLGFFDRSKFIPAKNSDFKAIEDVGKVTGLLN